MGEEVLSEQSLEDPYRITAPAHSPVTSFWPSLIFSHHLQYRIQDLDFDIEIIELSLIDGTFGFDSGNGTFNGMIGVLQREDADIAAQVNKIRPDTWLP